MTIDDASAPDQLPVGVRSLLREHIESYEELEILLALERLAGAEKTAEELSATLRIKPALVETAVRELESHGLIARRPSPLEDKEARFRYAPTAPALDTVVRALARVYAEHPIPIIKIMSENAIHRVRTGAVRAFADAFILRKDKNDDG